MKKNNPIILISMFMAVWGVVSLLGIPCLSNTQALAAASVPAELPGAVKADHRSLTTVQGWVKHNALPVGGVWVQIATSHTRSGDGVEAQIVESKTDANGYFSIPLTIDTPANYEYGVVRVFSNDYFQSDFKEIYQVAGGKNYTITIPLGKLAATDKVPGAAGFRTSWYGLKNNGGLPALNCFMNSMVDFNARQSPYLASVPMVYFAITQTEPYNGQAWGKTYALWNNTGTALGTPFEYVSASEMKFDFHAVIRYINQYYPNTLVFLQLEPGLVDQPGHETMEKLLVEVLDEFVGRGDVKIHRIAGIGVDGEWYRFCEDMAGKNPPPSVIKPNIISADKAQKWERIVRGYGVNMSLFLKHFTNRANNYWADAPNDNCNTPEHGDPFDDYLPSEAYCSTFFINDSQDFDWLEDGVVPTPAQCLARMVEDFTKWVTYYNHGQSIPGYSEVRYWDPCKVPEGWVSVTNPNPKPRYHGFQIGYPDDEAWWKTYGNKGALTTIPNTLTAKFRKQFPGSAFGFYWVDFTLRHEYVYKQEMLCQ
ncbi:MAG: hypothetical protein EHM45_00660 [Desulfobacteraceae bacterium]|nr:MAG: hypothetical protein EHM45_00660 [Desulfobacteraceae bacterium]